MLKILQSNDFSITEDALNYINTILKNEADRGEVFLRLIIDVGGCAGMKYHFIVDDYFCEDSDFCYQVNGKNMLVIDDFSFENVKGSKMYLEDDLQNTELKLENPNIVNSCSCGSSFSCGS